MKKKAGSLYAGIKSGSIDWVLLIFLLLFLNVKLLIKIAVVLLLFLVRRDFRFGFRIQKTKLPLFYPIMIGIAVINWVISGKMTNLNYGLVMITGISFWLLCILVIHQVRIAIEKNSIDRIHRTILVFFIINAIVSLATYAWIIWETGTFNPYRYQGNFQKYFIGTGDYIKGISFDTSTTNAVLSAAGVLYFLSYGKNGMTILCMAVLLLTGSNISTLLLCGALLFVFFFQSNKEQKSIIVICLLMLVTFLVKISPENNKYFVSVYQQLFEKTKKASVVPAPEVPVTQKPDSILTADEKKQKVAQLYLDSVTRSIFERDHPKTAAALAPWPATDQKERPVIPVPSIHTPPFQHKDTVSVTQKRLLGFVENNAGTMPIASGASRHPALPGKILAFRQTIDYLLAHPVRIPTGAGMGNFSSKLAFRVTAMKIAGGYPARFAYINDDFRSNHLDLYSYFFTGRDELHSITNSPNSTYDQLLGEYGILGLLSFPLFYVSFFRKAFRRRTYGIPVMLFMLGVFAVDYWFEQLSVVVVFELLLLLNIKEMNTKQEYA